MLVANVESPAATTPIGFAVAAAKKFSDCRLDSIDLWRVIQHNGRHDRSAAHDGSLLYQGLGGFSRPPLR